MTAEGLRQARLAFGLTQHQLAERLGVPQATIWRWESGAHPIRHPKMLEWALLAIGDHLDWIRAREAPKLEPEF